MFPDDAARAALDGGAKKAIPVHWGRFNLSYQHTRFGHPAAFAQNAKIMDLPIHLPLMGDIFDISSTEEDPWQEN
jgi:L-ascorbate metabolism protein UlaG (beta-lactamase superfamily)